MAGVSRGGCEGIAGGGGERAERPAAKEGSRVGPRQVQCKDLKERQAVSHPLRELEPSSRPLGGKGLSFHAKLLLKSVVGCACVCVEGKSPLPLHSPRFCPPPPPPPPPREGSPTPGRWREPDPLGLRQGKRKRQMMRLGFNGFPGLCSLTLGGGRQSGRGKGQAERASGPLAGPVSTGERERVLPGGASQPGQVAPS